MQEQIRNEVMYSIIGTFSNQNELHLCREYEELSENEVAEAWRDMTEIPQEESSEHEIIEEYNAMREICYDLKNQGYTGSMLDFYCSN